MTPQELTEAGHRPLKTIFHPQPAKLKTNARGFLLTSVKARLYLTPIYARTVKGKEALIYGDAICCPGFKVIRKGEAPGIYNPAGEPVVFHDMAAK